MEDCSYTREFTGTQLLDMDYLCPACTVQVQGTATMTEGLDCYGQISSSASTERAEHWGWSDTHFYRTSLTQYPLVELQEFTNNGEGEESTLAWSSEREMSDGGSMVLTASGSLSWFIDDDTLLADPWPTPTAPYTCGWPQEDPGTLVLDYTLAEGNTFPNVRLEDQCGEQLALWDLYGRWLVLDSSQSDCGPCRLMADGAEDFVESMAGEGIEVMVVSLLGNGLSDPAGTPDTATLTSWVEDYGLTDPVLYDRGFGYALFPDFIENSTGESFGYPAWLVVDPTMTLVHGNVGFSSWDDVSEVIRDKAR
jgi:peroxiredoxin